MCSVDKARALGIAEDRWVFIHSGTDCHEHQFVSNRWSFSETPAIELGGRTALELAGLDDRRHRHRRPVLVLPVGRAARRAEPRAGPRAPADAHRRAAVRRRTVEQLRHARDRHDDGRPARPSPASDGLVWANGGYATKHAFGVYSHRRRRPTASVTPTRRTRSTRCPDASWPSRSTPRAGDDRGVHGDALTATVHPETAIAACLLADGRRAWGTSTDADLAAAMCDGEWVGRAVTLDDAGTMLTSDDRERWWHTLRAMAAPDRPSIVLDCDPGTTTRSPSSSPRATPTCSASRRSPATRRSTAPRATRSSCATCSSIDVPVHSGCRAARWSPSRSTPTYVHGESGIDGADLPEPSGPPDEHRRGRLHHRDVPRQRGHVARADRAADQHRPRAARRTRPRRPHRRHLADGRRHVRQPHRRSPSSTSGPTPRQRPTCSTYGGPLIMAGLDLTHQFQATPERIDRVRAIPGRLAAVLADLFVFFSGTYVARHDNMRRRAGARSVRGDGADPSRAVRAAARARRRRDPGRAHPRHDGDRPAPPARACPTPNCAVLTDVDADAGFAVIVEAIASFSRLTHASLLTYAARHACCRDA